MSSTRQLTVALVGRPNVGKSTLFNRLLGRRQAIVSSIRGTTRDRLYGQCEWRGVPLQLIDMGGVEWTRGAPLAQAVQRHIARAFEDADAFVLVCDAQEGWVPADAMLIEALRKTGKPIMLAANKADAKPIVPSECFSLGLAHVVPISALHGRGIGELLDHLVELLPHPPACLVAGGGPEQTGPPGAARSGRGDPPSMAVAILGRQNVGKSSLLNALLREERAIVSEVPGTTRDVIDTRLTVNGKPIVLVDTAGLRHRRKVKNPIDLFAMSRTADAIARCDVALVVLDATQGLTRDDQRIIAMVDEDGCGLVLLVNKWDLVKGGNERTLTEAVRRRLPAALSAPVLAVSAKTGFHVGRALPAARNVFEAMQRGLPESTLFELLQRAWHAHPAPRMRGRPVRLQAAKWCGGRPVRLELTATKAGKLPRAYQRYLLNALHADPQLAGVPVRLIWNT